MKRILSILILVSILICSLAACGGESSDSDYSANTEPETIDSEQEAVAQAKAYCYDGRIASKLGFTRFKSAKYFYKEVDTEYVEEGELNYEHGDICYSVSMRGDMVGQDAYGDYDIKKFEYFVKVYPDGYVWLIYLRERD